MLLINLLETFPWELTRIAVVSSWAFAKSNLEREKQSLCLKYVTCQLLCVLLWKHAFKFLEVLIKENKLETLMKQIQSYAKKLEEYQEIKRVILGTNSDNIGVCTYLAIMK
jgi:hypothetical protein